MSKGRTAAWEARATTLTLPSTSPGRCPSSGQGTSSRWTKPERGAHSRRHRLTDGLVSLDLSSVASVPTTGRGQAPSRSSDSWNWGAWTRSSRLASGRKSACLEWSSSWQWAATYFHGCLSSSCGRSSDGGPEARQPGQGMFWQRGETWWIQFYVTGQRVRGARGRICWTRPGSRRVRFGLNLGHNRPVAPLRRKRKAGQTDS